MQIPRPSLWTRFVMAANCLKPYGQSGEPAPWPPYVLVLGYCSLCFLCWKEPEEPTVEACGAESGHQHLLTRLHAWGRGSLECPFFFFLKCLLFVVRCSQRCLDCVTFFTGQAELVPELQLKGQTALPLPVTLATSRSRRKRFSLRSSSRKSDDVPLVRSLYKARPGLMWAKRHEVDITLYLVRSSKMLASIEDLYFSSFEPSTCCSSADPFDELAQVISRVSLLWEN